MTDLLARRRKRRVSRYAGLVVPLGLIGVGYGLLVPSGHPAATVESPASAVQAGRALYLVSCAACHGLSAQGGSNAPSLIGVGAAAVDFQVSTGRMPLSSYDLPEAPRKPPRFTQQQIDELAAYVASLAPGPAIPSNLNYANADEATGGELFRTNCASCHNAVGSGGELTSGRTAPSLSQATARQIYEAMLTGPENMPVFSDKMLTPQEKLDIIKYIEQVRAEPNPGGNGLGRIGPIPEGLLGWLFGLGAIVIVAVWIGSRA